MLIWNKSRRTTGEKLIGTGYGRQCRNKVGFARKVLDQEIIQERTAAGKGCRMTEGDKDPGKRAGKEKNPDGRRRRKIEM